MAELIRNTEVAWAAGLFEGEGHVTANYNAPRGRPRVVVTLSICDKDVFDRFVAIVGVGSVRLERLLPSQHRDRWVWQITGKSAKPILEMLLPWMGKRRREAVERGLRLVQEIGPTNAEKTHCPKGHPYVLENTYVRADGSRRCKTCCNAANSQARWLGKLVVASPS